MLRVGGAPALRPLHAATRKKGAARPTRRRTPKSCRSFASRTRPGTAARPPGRASSSCTLHHHNHYHHFHQHHNHNHNHNHNRVSGCLAKLLAPHPSPDSRRSVRPPQPATSGGNRSKGRRPPALRPLRPPLRLPSLHQLSSGRTGCKPHPPPHPIQHARPRLHTGPPAPKEKTGKRSTSAGLRSSGTTPGWTNCLGAPKPWSTARAAPNQTPPLW